MVNHLSVKDYSVLQILNVRWFKWQRLQYITSNIIYNTKYNISIIPIKLNNEWQVLKIIQ